LVEFGAISVPAGDPPLLVGDVGRLGGELKWKPTFDLETGLDQTIEWWAQRLGSSSERSLK
jgi:nucleoside-diphosphate-sugar epimerase